MKQRNSAILSYGRTIRKATANDVSLIMDFIRQGRAKMIAAGNVNQWSDKHPSRQTIERDIAQGASYLLCENDTPIATFALLAGPEPTYSYIEGGRWLDDQPYYVIHRVASAEGVHGVMSDIIAYCLSLTSTIRIDTHADNLPMQAALKRLGFNYCGIIYLEGGSQRQAYQLSL